MNLNEYSEYCLERRLRAQNTWMGSGGGEGEGEGGDGGWGEEERSIA